MTPQDVERDLAVDVALRWGTGYDTELRSFVNVIATPKGGTHVGRLRGRRITATFNEVHALAPSVLKVGEHRRASRRTSSRGMTAVVAVRLAEPQFEGQTKEVLGTPAVRSDRAQGGGSAELKAVADLDQDGPEGGRPGWALEKVAERLAKTRTRGPGSTARRSDARTALESSGAAGSKLADCRSSDMDRSELFIVEGDSALGTAKLARDSEFQALLPIRGKILNVQKASVGDMLKNAECASIIQVVGAGSGRTFDLDSRRATAGSSSWPTPTPTGPTSAACWPPCSSPTCPS